MIIRLLESLTIRTTIFIRWFRAVVDSIVYPVRLSSRRVRGLANQRGLSLRRSIVVVAPSRTPRRLLEHLECPLFLSLS